MSGLPSQRVVQLTFHKCGSQWVRDVLTSPAIQKHSGIASSDLSYSVLSEGWRQQEPGTFVGPVYNASVADWAANRQAGDRAIVILRDPRDRLISWMFSAAYSHAMKPAIKFWRDLLLPMNNHARILLGMLELDEKVKLFDGWCAEPSSEHTYVTSYERLVAEEAAEFRRIVDFLGWEIPEEVLQKEVKTFSFNTRSGRSPGDENVFSHYRKGAPGDWRRHFDREMGALWEERMPGLLTRLGYESDGRWYENLPEVAEAASGEEKDRHALALEVTALSAQAVRSREEWEIRRLSYKAQRDFLRRRIKRLRKLLLKFKKKRIVRCLRKLAKTRRWLKRLGRSRA